MKPLNPFVHGILDYVVALLLIVSPWLFGFNDVSTVATQTMVTVGIIVFLLSIVTNYPLSVAKLVPFRTHGVIETMGAIALLASPWLLGYNDVTSAGTTIAVAVSVVWLAVVALTNYKESYDTRTIH